MAKILRAYILFWGVLAIQSCGQKESSSDLKISGGVQSYYLDRVAEFTVGVNQTCTGVMLSDNHVLTAAHCVSSSLMDVYFGYVPKIPGGLVDPIRSVAVATNHPGYDRSRTGFEDDLAILTLLEPDGGNHADYFPVELFSGAFIPMEMTIAGFGQQTENGNTPQEQIGLRKAQVMRDTSINDPNFIHYYSLTGSHCQGDSGGPILASGAYQSNGSPSSFQDFFLLGVASHFSSPSQRCAGSGAYVNVLNYRPWIDTVMRQSIPCLKAIRQVDPDDGFKLPKSCLDLSDGSQTEASSESNSEINSAERFTEPATKAATCINESSLNTLTWAVVTSPDLRFCATRGF